MSSGNIAFRNSPIFSGKINFRQRANSSDNIEYKTTGPKNSDKITYLNSPIFSRNITSENANASTNITHQCRLKFSDKIRSFSVRTPSSNFNAHKNETSSRNIAYEWKPKSGVKISSCSRISSRNFTSKNINSSSIAYRCRPKSLGKTSSPKKINPSVEISKKRAKFPGNVIFRNSPIISENITFHSSSKSTGETSTDNSNRIRSSLVSSRSNRFPKGILPSWNITFRNSPISSGNIAFPNSPTSSGCTAVLKSPVSSRDVNFIDIPISLNINFINSPISAGSISFPDSPMFSGSSISNGNEYDVNDDSAQSSIGGKSDICNGTFGMEQN